MDVVVDGVTYVKQYLENELCDLHLRYRNVGCRATYYENDVVREEAYKHSLVNDQEGERGLIGYNLFYGVHESVLRHTGGALFCVFLGVHPYPEVQAELMDVLGRTVAGTGVYEFI